MAVVESIPEKNQTPSAQKGVLDYCMQPSKTFDEDEQLAYISGYNCIPEQANESFLATQKIFGHEPDGVRFYHFVQSFKIGEDISPQEANEIGMELAKIFENREVIVNSDLRELNQELRYQGNNLNQLTKLCHQGRISTVDLSELLSLYRQILLALGGENDGSC